ncbi:hypothetical protein LUZ63_005561 [Rhynchospora breviuscula]|uniref:Dirigent protein n=1 Tax=Rhynchospora breviuscula TaxID=2022672 RepID=A0A9Q0HSP9_9POAL|nr:hypothetical protein LUZ63_005561 [Rhynchospora breviuscula]
MQRLKVESGSSLVDESKKEDLRITVVKPARNDSAFGSIGVFDDMLKDRPDPSFKLIDGPYNGSTLAIFGRGVLGTVMERGIVGGTGKFRMSRGYTVRKQVTPPGPPIQLYKICGF